MKRTIAKLFASYGILLEPHAVTHVLEQENPVGFARQLIPLLKSEHSGILSWANIRQTSESNGIGAFLKKKEVNMLTNTDGTNISAPISPSSKEPVTHILSKSSVGNVPKRVIVDAVEKNIDRKILDIPGNGTPTTSHWGASEGKPIDIQTAGRMELDTLTLSEFPDLISSNLTSKDNGAGITNIDIAHVKGYSPRFSKLEPKIEIVKDITGQSLCEGQKDDFFKFFNSRFSKMKEIIRRNPLVRNPLSIELVKKRGRFQVRGGDSTSVIGMVAKIRQAKSGEIYGFDIEDETGRLECRIGRNSGATVGKGLVLDETLAVMGKMARDNRDREVFYVDKIIHPNAPWGRPMDLAKEDTYAVFISDIHIGSNTFLEAQWIAFIKWLNGASSNNLDIVNRIKYLVINGDNVDGIGVHPNQKYDLAVKDIYEQYELLGKYLKMIPEHIEIVMLPGNHDAVRRTEPQPALQDEMMDSLKRNIRLVGNPSHFNLEGVKVLSYHGASIDDWITALNHLNYSNPLESMKEMMVRRHILPMYGMKTPLAPEKEDLLIIDPVPDIFITGHTHSFGVMVYRNTLLINGSTWQSQTDYQKMHNFNPIPAKVVAVNLHTLKHTSLDFMQCRPEPYTAG